MQVIVAGAGVAGLTLADRLTNKGIKTLIIEREDDVKMSFRSKGDIEINLFARKYFNGGGHQNAAGGESHCGLYDTIRMFEESIAVYLNGSL